MAARPFDPLVYQLGYVALESADFERSCAHYIDKVGLTETARDDEGARYLSVGYNSHDLVLKPAQGKALLHLGFPLSRIVDLSAFEKQLGELGLPVARKSDSQPGIPLLLDVEGPGAHRMQFYHDMGASMPGFKQTGVAPMRLGHVAVISPEAPKLMQFYQEVLGFCHTDSFEGVANFLTCNRDHHVLNLVTKDEYRVHHIAFELTDNAAHPRAADALAAKGVPTLWGPVRHTAGHNLAAYHHDPDQVMVELYTEMDVFVPERNACEPRPWHEFQPMVPKSWGFSEMSTWETSFVFDLAHG